MKGEWRFVVVINNIGGVSFADKLFFFFSKSRFCNFMHLCHPTRSLVSALQASQRVSRRRAHKGAEVDSGDMGWTPAVAAGGEGDLGWMPERRY